MFKDISSVSLAFLYVNILGFFFHSIVSRSLGPAGYGEFMVLYSFMLVVGNITALLSTVGVKTLVENLSNKFEVLRSLRQYGIFIGAFFAFIACIMSPVFKNFLNVTEIYYFFIIAFIWLGMFSLAVERSFLQATGRFRVYAFSTAFECTIKLLAAIIATYIGLKIGGVLSASAVAIFLSLLFLISINRELWGKKIKLSIKKMIKIAVYVSPSGLFVYADDIFIRRIFDSHTAGLFASASIIGKILIWFSLSILAIYFPKFVHSKTSSALKKFALQMFGIVLITEFGAQVVFFIIGKPLFLMLFGSKFEPALQFIPYYFLAILPLIIDMIFISLATAVEKGLTLIYIHLIVFYSLFIFLSFSSIFDYLEYIFSINLFFFFLYLWMFKKEIFITNKDSQH